MLIRRELVVVFTGLRRIFYRGVFHHLVWFVWLGCFLSPRIAWSAHPPRGVCITGGLGDLCFSALPPPECLIGATFLIPAHRGGALLQESSWASLTARFRLPWFGPGVFCHPLHSIAAQVTDWPSTGARWTQQAWYSICRGSFWLSDQSCRSAVLSYTRPSSLRPIYVADPVIAQHWRRRGDIFFVLAMTIHRPYYLLLLTCCVVFWSKCTTHV